MIFLEEIVNQILREEGQIIASLDDYGITWLDLESLLKSTVDQAKDYVPIYDWEQMELRPQPKYVPDIVSVKHIVYNAYPDMQKILPDIQRVLWEFNPYKKQLRALAASNYSLEVTKYAYCDYIEYNCNLNKLKKDKLYAFALPGTFDPTTFVIKGKTKDMTYESEDESTIKFSGKLGKGIFDCKSLQGSFILNNDEDMIELNMTSQYKGVLSLDMTCELFYTWFKVNLLGMIGGVKEQINLDGIGLPFNINADGLLQRSRELSQKLEDLKVTKMRWSNF